VTPTPPSRLRIAAIGFLNPAPLMWDFEHEPLDAPLARRYQIDRMTPAECADRLATGSAEIGLVPIAALASNPGLRILPGCVIASKGRVRSLLLVRRASQSLQNVRTVAADTASRATLAYTRILFRHWGNANAAFLPAVANLDAMLEQADTAILIGDPALIALEERASRLELTGEELVYHDLAAEWRALTGLPFVSAVWCCAACGEDLVESISRDLIQSRDNGLQNIDALAAEWSCRIPIPEASIRAYLSINIHYLLDEECMEGMRVFFRMAAEAGVLPAYNINL
jgi:chorismate dehydratase